MAAPNGNIQGFQTTSGKLMAYLNRHPCLVQTSEASIKPEPPTLKDNSEWPTIASVAAEAPYRLPSQLDFNRLKDIVEARRMNAEDYIRDLREDPGYFADVLVDLSEHRLVRLLDTFEIQSTLFDKHISGKTPLKMSLAGQVLIRNDTKEATTTRVYAGLVNLEIFVNKDAKKALDDLKIAVYASPAISLTIHHGRIRSVRFYKDSRSG
ncbi:hypothetical protein DID88_007642 [Monilinia fructigena]|uniref:Uncharacterized protein n=1 Tax=Monilinia fructigena TaxID=38457 RepID=A0A395J305_9HELO|nr:hypothetical protein DID88_007642 [Monilinia fructigena]